MVKRNSVSRAVIKEFGLTKAEQSAIELKHKYDYIKFNKIHAKHINQYNDEKRRINLF